MSVIINPLTKMVPNVKAPRGRGKTLGPQIPRGGWEAEMKARSVFLGGGPPSSPVVVTAVLEVNQHEAVSIFWL